MAVELLASVLQHPLEGAAPAKLIGLNENASLLGATPHQIRGFISRFHFMTPTVRRFTKCIACGDQINNLYKEENFEFLKKVFQNPCYLEEVLFFKNYFL